MWRSGLMVLFMASWAVAADPAELRRRLETEAGVAWGEYLQLTKHVKGTCSEQLTDLKTGEVQEELDYITFISDDESGLIELGTKGRRLLQLANERYECSLCEFAPGKWKLQQFEWQKPRSKQISSGLMATRGEGEDTISTQTRQLACAYAWRGLIIQTAWLPAMFVSPSFKVVDVEQSDEIAPGLVRVKFEYAPTSTRNPLRNGWVVLDPARYWQIRRAKVQIEDSSEEFKGSIDVENEFDDTTTGFPYPARSLLRTRGTAPDVSVERQSIYSMRLETIDTTDLAPFQLATYGLAEPNDSAEME